MSLIAMAVYDTEANERTKYTRRTLEGLLKSVGRQHRIIVVDNNSCQATKDILNGHYGSEFIKVITLDKNIGTAEAINKAWHLRKEGEHCIKIDNDIIINNCTDWVEQLEECVRRDSTIGQVGLKRKDCIENVLHENPFYKSKLTQLSHEPGQRWIIVEEQFHVMGSCVLHSSALLERVGYLYQVGLYGFDDSNASAYRYRSYRRRR